MCISAFVRLRLHFCMCAFATAFVHLRLHFCICDCISTFLLVHFCICDCISGSAFVHFYMSAFAIAFLHFCIYFCICDCLYFCICDCISFSFAIAFLRLLSILSFCPRTPHHTALNQTTPRSYKLAKLMSDNVDREVFERARERVEAGQKKKKRIVLGALEQYHKLHRVPQCVFVFRAFFSAPLSHGGR